MNVKCVHLNLFLPNKFRRNVFVDFAEFFLEEPNTVHTSPFMRDSEEDALYPGTRYGHGILPSLLWTFVTIGLIAVIMVKFLSKQSSYRHLFPSL